MPNRRSRTPSRDDLANQPVDHSVRASRAVAERLLREAFRAGRGLALVLDLDGGIRTDIETVAAAVAVFGSRDSRVVVPLHVDVRGHLEDVLRTCVDAQLAPLAAVLLDDGRRHASLLSCSRDAGSAPGAGPAQVERRHYMSVMRGQAPHRRALRSLRQQGARRAWRASRGRGPARPFAPAGRRPGPFPPSPRLPSSRS